MNLLVLNGGSSSIKFSVYALEVDGSEPVLILDGELSGMATADAMLAMARDGGPEERKPVEGAETVAGAIAAVLDAVASTELDDVKAVGYRVVHPGAEINDHCRIDEEVIRKVDEARSFAPLHDPEAVAMIRETMKRLPSAQHFACFDTVFHQTMPNEASIYAIPQQYRAEGVRRYGFHGLSCESIVRQLQLAGPLPRRVVIAHLGSGCSITAVQDGVSIDTTMGLTPTGGIPMGTRPGDLDPGLVLYLLRQQSGPDPAGDLERALNHDAGMVALSGLANDMKAVRKAAADGDEAALLALKVFTRSIRKAIGSFAWLMEGLDAIVFTGGIGQHDPATRAEVLAGSEASINSSSNQSQGGDLRQIQASHSKIMIFAAPAQEELVIALHVKRMFRANR